MEDKQEASKIEKNGASKDASGLGLPKPFEQTMHQALKSTVEVLREDVRETEKQEAPEARFEHEEPQQKEKIAEAAQKESISPVATSSASVIATKDEMTQRIESILAEHLEDDYRRMPRELQVKFKAKGEETAQKIRKALMSTKVKARKIIHLVLSWLKIIPGVNSYFLKQEAKIKADKLMLMKDEILANKSEIL